MFFTAAPADCSFAGTGCFRRPVTGAISLSAKLGEDDNGAKRRRALKLVDRALSKQQYKTALSLVKQLQGKSGGLRAFGSAKQITRKHLELDEPELDGIDLPSLRPLVDSILDSIQQSIQVSSLEVISIEKLENLITARRRTSPTEEHLICAQHEAGHFLVGYLMGVLPKEYQVPTIQELSHNQFEQGNVAFVGFEFLKQIDSVKILCESVDIRASQNRASKGEISWKTLNQFSCVILGGLVAEILVVGKSDGHHADVCKLEGVLRWLGLPKNEAELHLKWAATNTALTMHRHHETRSRLAEAMALGKSIGTCIDTIESCLQGKDF